MTYLGTLCLAHEFARNLPVPTNLNLIHLKPLRGTGLVVFSPSLVFIAVIWA